MSLSIVNDKVRVKARNAATWYEFGLERINGRIHSTDLVAVADPGGADEEIILPFGEETFAIYAFEQAGRGYLEVGQDASALPTNGPVSLETASGLSYLLVIVEGANGRKYRDYALDQPEYAAGVVTKKLTAKFTGQGRTYNMRHGDDIRDIPITLTENNRDLAEQPESAVMKVMDAEGELVAARELTHVGGGDWRYRVSDADFTDELVVGLYTIEVYGSWADLTNGTFPTNGALTLNVYEKKTTADD